MVAASSATCVDGGGGVDGDHARTGAHQHLGEPPGAAAGVEHELVRELRLQPPGSSEEPVATQRLIGLGVELHPAIALPLLAKAVGVVDNIDVPRDAVPDRRMPRHKVRDIERHRAARTEGRSL